MINAFNEADFHSRCDALAKKDKQLKNILKQHGYPPMWQRKPNFETLIHIILEQQVSLASAKAALNKLKEKIGAITPKKLLELSDEELRSCYFSRQKTKYAKHLAWSIVNGELSIRKIVLLDDEDIRKALKKIKGIGDWTVDVFLLMALQRADIFPTGDLAMIKSLKKVKQLAEHTSKEEIIVLAEKWKPHRSVATMILWHSYIKEKKIKI
ncbi:MAG: DNA-3-methyladenine glycosylase 2 family protein [Bacteroidetes bacterium]|nr:DNA-3-methyladenine glycosylase 2 family protein [Bacteroidota bacterium]